MKRFYVQYEDTCPECNGKKWIHNPQWVELGKFLKQWEKENPRQQDEDSSGYNARKWQAERKWWFEEQDCLVQEDSKGLPWDEATCPECEGTGQISGRVPLEDALREMSHAG